MNFARPQILAALFLVASSCPALSAMTFTFAGSGTQSGLNITIGDLTDGTPTSSYGQLTVSGDLSGVSNTDGFTFFASGYSSSSLAGNSLTLGSAVDFTRSNSTGWGVINGDINSDSPQRALGFTFNLTNLPANTGIRITSVTALNDGGTNTDNVQVVVDDVSATTTDNVQVVVDDVSATTLGGLSASGLAIDVANGDLVAFRNVGTGASDYRLRSITFETYSIPEPSVAILGSLGTLLLLRRRRC